MVVRIKSKSNFLLHIFFWGSFGFFSSCRSFQQTILFQTKSSINLPVFHEAYQSASRNYQISPMDYIAISVFTNKGEVLIDPNKEFEGDTGEATGGQIGSFNTGTTLPISGNMQRPKNYLINSAGIVKLPMVGKVHLAGYTLTEADSILTIAYESYYEDPYVLTQYLNKRVVLLGALGDQVIPLREENITLIELLAMASTSGKRSFQQYAKGNNVRILRGSGENLSIQLVDLTSIEGVQLANLDLMPNDVVYVEPRRKLDRQTIMDINTVVSPFTTVVSAITGMVSLYLLIERLSGK